jgi:hypothetical protein
MPTKKTIQDLQKIALSHKGECLSEIYVNIYTHYSFKCGKGHIWQSKGINIFNGHWCPLCNHRKYTIQDIQEKAKLKGGECLSPTYKDITTKYRFRCHEGHEWEMAGTQLLAGYWCPQERNRKVKSPFKELLKELKEILAKKEGKCLSKSFRTTKDKYLFQCKEGHEWETPMGTILQGHWCPTCAIHNRTKPKKYQDLLKKTKLLRGIPIIKDSGHACIALQCDPSVKYFETYIHDEKILIYKDAILKQIRTLNKIMHQRNIYALLSVIVATSIYLITPYSQVIISEICKASHSAIRSLLRRLNLTKETLTISERVSQNIERKNKREEKKIV